MKFSDEPYGRVIIPDAETDTYTAYMLEFPGCVTEGSSVEEAYRRLDKAAESWIAAALDLGQDIPLPATLTERPG